MPWEEMSKVWSPGPPQSVKGDVTKPTYWPSPPPRSPSNISNFRLQTSWFQLQTLCPKMSKVSWHCPAASSSRISTCDTIWMLWDMYGYVTSVAKNAIHHGRSFIGWFNNRLTVSHQALVWHVVINSRKPAIGFFLHHRGAKEVLSSAVF